VIKTGKVAIPVNDGKAVSHVHNTGEHNMKQKSNTDVEVMIKNNNMVQTHALHTNVNNKVQNIQMLQMIKTGKVAIPVNDGKALSHVHNTEERNMDHKNNISYHTETTYETAIDDTITKLRILFPEQVATEQKNKIKNVAIEGYKLADSVYTAKDAEDWGDHYKVSEKLVNSDEKLFKASMRDIKAMTIRRQKN
jgi:ABC-type uncharacterized transport system involved in gliding motility auxiliary subunit